MARFTQVDPATLSLASDPSLRRIMLADPQRLNPYAYALNNPLRYTDPSGAIVGVDDALIISLLVGTITAVVITAPDMADYSSALYNHNWEAAGDAGSNIALKGSLAIDLSLAVGAEAAAVVGAMNYNSALRASLSGEAAQTTAAVIPSQGSQKLLAAPKEQKLLGEPITIDESDWQHATSRHMPGGSQSSGKSVFSIPESEVRDLVGQATHQPREFSLNGYSTRTVNAGREIGYDRENNYNSTQMYTVVTRPGGGFVTTHPGRPRPLP